MLINIATHRRSLRLPLILFLAISFLALGGCAEVTKPTPTAPQIEAAQLATARRHPYQNWGGERTSRVFLRLMPWLPQTQGRTYPFVGFNWWVTATGQVVVDQVWNPSPAKEAGLLSRGCHCGGEQLVFAHLGRRLG